MDKIEPTLAEAMQTNGQTNYPVLITFDGDHTALIRLLNSLDTPAGRNLMPMGIVTATLTAGEIRQVAALSITRSVGLDEDAQAQ